MVTFSNHFWVHFEILPLALTGFHSFRAYQAYQWCPNRQGETLLPYVVWIYNKVRYDPFNLSWSCILGSFIIIIIISPDGYRLAYNKCSLNAARCQSRSVRAQEIMKALSVSQ